MNNQLILLVSILFSVSIFLFILCVYATKIYKKNELKLKLQRQLVANFKNKNKISIFKILNIRMTKLEKMFIKADIKNVDIEKIIFSFIVFMLCSLLLNIYFNIGLLLLILPIAIIGIGVFFLNKKASDRINAINTQFTYSLQDFADELRVNSDLYNAIKSSIDSANSPLKEELQIICSKVETNVDIIQALKEFADRTDSSAINSWVDAIIFANDKSSNTSEVCINCSKKLKERIRKNNSIKTKLDSLKTLAIILMSIFSLILLGMYNYFPGFSHFLETTLGKVIFVYTALSYTVTTTYIFRKIDKISTSL